MDKEVLLVKDFSLENVYKTREKYAGKILSNGDVIDLIIKGDLNEIDTIVQWEGSDIPEDERPILRFAGILAKDFDNIEENQKEKFLFNSLRFVVGDFRQMSNFENNDWELIGKSGKSHTLPIKQRNLAELLNSILKFKNNDLQAAKELLTKAPFRKKQDNQYVGLITYSLYCPQPDSTTAFDLNQKSIERAPKTGFIQESHLEDSPKIKNRAIELLSIREEYQAKNPRIRLLAFWLNACTGGENPHSSKFDTLLENIYPKSDVELKTQIMTFVKESLFAYKIPEIKYFMIERIADEELVKPVDTDGLNLSLINESSSVKKILEIDRIIRQTEDGKTTAEELVSYIEKSPTLLAYITEKELKRVMSKTKDHGLAAKIARLIVAKQTQGEKLSSTPLHES